MIKLGGSVITDKNVPFKAREKEVLRLAKDIRYILRNSSAKCIIAHGSGSFGHTVASKYKTHLGIINKDSVYGAALVSDAAIKINRIVIENFLKAGLPAVSFSPASFILSRNQKPQSVNIKPFIVALKNGFIPVVYGDVVFDAKNGFCIYSGEKTLNTIALKLKDKNKRITLIQCGDTNGVYDNSGMTIRKITEQSFGKYRASIGGSSKTDVTGGMLHKIQEALKMSQKGVKTIIINGNTKKELVNTVLFHKYKGTLVA